MNRASRNARTLIVSVDANGDQDILGLHPDRLRSRFAYPNMVERPSDLFRALGDPTRLRILHLLRVGELCVGDLVSVLGVPQPTASRHVTYLRKVGLITARKNSYWTFYALAPARTPVQTKAAGTSGRRQGRTREGRTTAKKPCAARVDIARRIEIVPWHIRIRSRECGDAMSALGGNRATRWNQLRFCLGMFQMAGAVAAALLLLATGVSTAALLAVVFTSVASTVSVLLFGSRRGGDADSR